MELKLVDALGELSEAATNDNLSKGFAIHRTETQTQVQRVEEAFDALGTEPTRRDDPLVDGLLAETEQFDARVGADGVRNRFYLDVAIQTERIEITRYEGLLRIAETADFGADVTDPLTDTLEQEAKTLRKLEGLAGEPGLETIWKTLRGL